MTAEEIGSVALFANLAPAERDRLARVVADISLTPGDSTSSSTDRKQRLGSAGHAHRHVVPRDGGPLSRRVAGRHRVERLVAAGLGLMTLAGVESTWLALLPGLLVVCIGTGLVNPALASVALGSVEGAQSGLAAGVNDAFRQGGIAVGVAAFGALVPAAAALGHGSPESYVAGMHTALLVGAALAAAGALASAVLLTGLRSKAPAGELVAEPA